MARSGGSGINLLTQVQVSFSVNIHKKVVHQIINEVDSFTPSSLFTLGNLLWIWYRNLFRFDQMEFPKYKKVEIRRKKWRGKQYYAIKDVVKALKGTPNTKGYIKYIRNRNPKLKRDWDKLTKQVSLPTNRNNQNIRSAHAENIKTFVGYIPYKEKEKKKKKKKFFAWLDRVDRE